MSQQEIHSAWESFFTVLAEIVPLMVVSGVVSICNFFQRHWRSEPFVKNKLIVGVSADIVYGSLVGCAALGTGRTRFLAWALAGAAVHFGIRRLEHVCSKVLSERYGYKDEKSDK